MGAGGGKLKGEVDEASLAAQYKLTPEQIHALLIAFKTGADAKAEIDKERFMRVVKILRDTNPELAQFNDEISGLVFTLCDTDHSGKVDPLEVVAALATFSSGDNVEKAKLVFKTIDKNGDGTLSKDEIRKHACKVLSFSVSLVKADTKASGKEAGMGFVGSMAASAISAALGALERKFADDIVRDVLTLTAAGDKVTQSEWLAGAQANNTVKALVDPNLSANAWRTIINPESGDNGEILEQLQKHPKGFAHIFDIQAADGKYQPLPKGIPPSPNLKLILVDDKKVTCTVDVLYASTLRELKTTAADQLKLGSNLALCKSDGSQLFGDSSTLRDLELNDGDTISVHDAANAHGTINIKTLTGKTFSVEFTAKDTILQIKQRIQDHEGIPTDQQRLLIGGKMMEDEKTASEYSVAANCTLHLILRLRSA